MVEIPLTLDPVGQSKREIYIAKLEHGFRIGERTADGEVSFVIPSGVVLDKVVQWLTTQT